MALKNYKLIILQLIFLSINFSLLANLANLTRNDPFPYFSSVYPFSYLATKQKAHLMLYDYTYPVSRFRFSASAYRQSADFGRNLDRDAVNLGDLPNGRWNMLGLFYDPVLRDKLFNLLDINFEFAAQPITSSTCELVSSNTTCFCLITDPRKSDPNKEFGFFTIPLLYRKYGVRFESELLLIDRCFYAVGLKIQFGVADIRQNILNFSDLTCQALGIACPANSGSPTSTNTCAEPVPTTPPAVAPPFINQATNPIPPCPATNCSAIGPVTPLDCVFPPQKFKPCCDQKLCLSFPKDCKQIVIEQIMGQRQLITDFLGIDARSYNKVGVEDFRVNLFWRQIFVINEDNDLYPRLLLMPFLEAGVGIPTSRQVNENKFFGLPIGNNSHVSAGMTFGFTLDFLDVMDFSFQSGFTKFFEREYCNFRLPTDPKESGIYPYTADVKLTPGTTWFAGFGIHAYRFLDYLSVWAEYLIVSHKADDIEICRSFIPSTSIYYERGFLVENYEKLTRWESQMFNIGFNYDLSPNLAVGVLWQAPVRQKNVYRSNTVLGTITFVY